MPGAVDVASTGSALRGLNGLASENAVLAGADDAGVAALAPESAAVTFYVVRHGKTLFNAMGKVQGWCDTPLTEEGVDVARRLGRGLAGVEFAAAFSSDSGRAVQTLSEVLQARAQQRGHSCGGADALRFGNVAGTPTADGLPLATDARLREWCYGDLEGEYGEHLHERLTSGFGEDVPFEELNRRLPQLPGILAAADQSGRAESYADITTRLRGFFYDAGEAVRLGGGGNVLVVTHSFVIRTLLYMVDPARVNDPVRIKNASVTQLRYDGAAFALGKTGSLDWLAD